ncbi:MAG: GYD domain-containing protein [Candidatus Methanomethyliales bacterium]|nr:GYD domain-containing protein [Candidatus Methanomethylicales archaeon]
MPYYVLLSTLTAEGRKTIKEKPDRIKEVNKEIEALGAKIIHQFATLGPYDFVNIIEAPGNETVYLISAEFGSRGTIQILSMPAIKIDAFIEGLKKGKIEGGKIEAL